ncbi:MAG: glutamate racemase, partial [Oscillospiraceae bacterium]|nr:glutamate racemase [Oscillospiraceae bacterium]
NIIYFGDTARVPYGTRSRETILEYAAQDIALISDKDVKVVIAACGTVSSALGDSVPCDLPFFGVVYPAANAAVRMTRNHIIGITGTPATVKSGAYERAIGNGSTYRCVSVACPLFVPMVENGITDPRDTVVRSMVERYLAPIKEHGADTVILGCTHYPHLEEAIREYMGDDVVLVSSGAAAASEALAFLGETNALTDREQEGSIICYTTDSPEMFYDNAHRFIGDIPMTVKKITVEQLVGKDH